MKQCGRCGSDISHRAPQARFCEDPECHRQRMLAFGRQSYHQHREQVRERQNAAHRARVAARPKMVRTCAHCGVDISDRGPNAKWCSLRCRDKARHRTDPARAREKAAVWREKNPERWREMWNSYKEANPERVLDQCRRAQQKRRAQKKHSAGNGISQQAWDRLLRRTGNRCAYCGELPARDERLAQDHVVPLARGGAHSEGNIVPACRPCNSSKNDRFLVEWRHGRRYARGARH